MPTSVEWRMYFEANAEALLSIPWDIGPELSEAEKADVARSVREFQAGESSEGQHLFRAAKAYADQTGDVEYLAALRLFIAEEQRHARDLGRFLTTNEIPLVKTTFTDRVFRRLRSLLGKLEVSVAVLVTAEIIAQVYYAALREATESKMLTRMCDQILRDEQRHVEFQTDQLEKLRAGRSRVGRMATQLLQRGLFGGTVLVVWYFHRSAIRRGGYGLRRWWSSCWVHFNAAFSGEEIGSLAVLADPQEVLERV